MSTKTGRKTQPSPLIFEPDELKVSNFVSALNNKPCLHRSRQGLIPLDPSSWYLPLRELVLQWIACDRDIGKLFESNDEVRKASYGVPAGRDLNQLG